MPCCNASSSADPVFLTDVLNAPLNRQLFAWVMTVLVPVMGIAANAVVVFIGAHVHLHKTGDFKYFLTTMAVEDILWCVSILLYRPYFTFGSHAHEYNVYALGPIPSSLRVSVRYMWMSTQMAMGFPVILLSINRYLLLCRSNKTYRTLFDGWRTPLLCIATLPLGAAINLPYLLDTTRHAKAALVAEFEEYMESYATDNWLNQLRIALITCAMLWCYAVGLSCAFGVFLKLNTHSRQPLSRADERRLRENQAVLRAIIIQTLLPLLITLPTVIDLLLLKSVQHNWWIQACKEWTLNLNPLCDALCTLYIIRPYRRVVRTWYVKAASRSDRVDSISSDKIEMTPCRTASQEFQHKFSVTTFAQEAVDDSG